MEKFVFTFFFVEEYRAMKIALTPLHSSCLIIEHVLTTHGNETAASLKSKQISASLNCFKTPIR